MELAQAVLTAQCGDQAAALDATRVRFSAHRCFARDGGATDRACLDALADYLRRLPGLAMCVDADGAFLKYFLQQVPALRSHVTCVASLNSADASCVVEGFQAVSVDRLPREVGTVFLCETLTFPRMRMRKTLPSGITIVEPDVLQEIALELVPACAWTPWARDTIYPIDVPEIEFEAGLDVLLIDCPARNLGLMPNGVGYVHNALKDTTVRFQTRDLDIILYHRFHIRRLFDEGGVIRLPAGRELPTDPWQAEHYDLWSDQEILEYFEPEIEEISRQVIAARPKILAMSIHACNEHFSAKVIEHVKAQLPATVILVGGFACYNADIGRRGFELADYMCIGEADLTVGPLVEQLAAGERPANTPGVISRYDDPAKPFIPAPMPHDLDLLEHPRYEWYDLAIYRNYNGYQLTPVIASRGCRWSRCTFCAERFYWRIRSPKAFVDEIEWLADQGCRLFMFNESDLNGMPEVVLEICDEIIRRDLNVGLTGQLRIHKKADRAFYQKLRQAGFIALRFGVDAFSENTLRLQKKGYTTATVRQNLKDCWEAGIYTEVNWVIGVPGETDEDIEEGIAFILENKPFIGRLANINPLILINGGVYWFEPEKHNIHFREDREELYRRYPRFIPAHLWYSTEPYIDELVRKDRFERIVLALHEHRFNVNAWAERVIEDVRLNRDMARVGAGRVEQADLRLSEGVGRMAVPDPDTARAPAFNADARSAAYVFRAGSSLPEDKIQKLPSQLCLVRYRDELYAIEPDKIVNAFGPDLLPDRPYGSGSVDVSHRVFVRLAATKAATPQLICSIGRYNIVQYDGLYYGMPQALGAAPWGKQDVTSLPGVITAKTLGEVSAEIEKGLGITMRRTMAREGDRTATGSKGSKPAVIPITPALRSQPVKSLPRLVGSLEGYNLVEYEGWFYGLPQSLGTVNLETVDAIEMPGVLRDLSREVVESEIQEAVAHRAVG